MYFFTPLVNVLELVGAVTAVRLEPMIATGFAVDPKVDESAAGLPFKLFAVMVRVAISPGT